MAAQRDSSGRFIKGSGVSVSVKIVRDPVALFTPSTNNKLAAVFEAKVIPLAKSMAPDGPGETSGRGRDKDLKDTIRFTPWLSKIGGWFVADIAAWFHERGTVNMESTPFLNPALRKKKRAIMRGLKG